jgi:peroxiredoxin
MTDSADAAGRSFFRSGRILRRVIYPVAVIAAIAGVIWWLEGRGDEDQTSSSGAEYGPRDIPAEFAAAGVDVGSDEGQMAPNFELEAYDGGETLLTDFRGQPVVLNFWAEWCRECRREMPQFVVAADAYADEGLVVVAVNQQEGKGTIEDFVEDYGLTFPVLLDRDGDVGEAYGVQRFGRGLPTTFFIDADGIVQSVYTGPFLEEVEGVEVQGAIDAGELDKRISEILPDEGGGADGSG